MVILPLTFIGDLTKETCQCGGVMLWRKHRVFSVRWRQECVCGRCGPWRSEPKREPLPMPIPPGMRNLKLNPVRED